MVTGDISFVKPLRQGNLDSKPTKEEREQVGSREWTSGANRPKLNPAFNTFSFVSILLKLVDCALEALVLALLRTDAHTIIHRHRQSPTHVDLRRKNGRLGSTCG